MKFEEIILLRKYAVTQKQFLHDFAEIVTDTQLLFVIVDYGYVGDERRVRLIPGAKGYTQVINVYKNLSRYGANLATYIGYPQDKIVFVEGFIYTEDPVRFYNHLLIQDSHLTQYSVRGLVESVSKMRRLKVVNL